MINLKFLIVFGFVLVLGYLTCQAFVEFLLYKTINVCDFFAILAIVSFILFILFFDYSKFEEKEKPFIDWGPFPKFVLTDEDLS